MNIIEIKDLVIDYKSEYVKGVNLNVKKGTIVALLVLMVRVKPHSLDQFLEQPK